MAVMEEVRLQAQVFGPTGIPSMEYAPPPVRFAPGSLLPKLERVSLTQSAFTALTPPTGAKAVLLVLLDAISLTLKGVTGDTGISLTPATAPLSVDVLLPLGATPSLGILNGHTSAQVVEVWWL